MERMERIKKYLVFIEILRMNVHENIIAKSSSNNVHEPRNAEFTAFLGSFLVE